MTSRATSKKNLDQIRQDEEEYRAAFNLFDKDGSGTISPEEFLEILKNMGQVMTSEQAEEIIKELDADGSGEIDFGEFISFMKKLKNEEEEGQIDEEDIVIKAFQSFDENNDNQISLDEFKNILCHMGQDRFTEEECEEIFKEADLNKDSYLNYREFVNYWKSK